MVSDLIKEYVDTNGLKYKVISERAGMKLNTFSSIMLGKRRLTVEEYKRICSALRVPPEKFLS